MSTLAEAIKTYCSSSIRVALPCRVESFDSVNQTVDLTPAIKDVTPLGEYTDAPMLIGVPVQFPGGSQFSITFPLAAGDEGLCIFSDSDISTWAIEGGIVNPNTPRQHHVADAVFIPGIRSTAHKLGEFKTDAIVVGKQGDVGVRVSAGKVELGVKHSETAIKHVAYAEDVKAALDAIVATFNTHVHSGVATGVGSSAVTPTLITTSTQCAAGVLVK
jgi:hypothetical protein